METKKKGPKFNLFDVIVVVLVVLVLAVAVGAYILLHQSPEEVPQTTEKTTFTVELTVLPENLLDAIEVGDSFKDISTGQIYGTVVSAESVPCVSQYTDPYTGFVYEREVEDYSNYRITLEADTLHDDGTIKTADGLIISIGYSVNISNGKMTGVGSILSIDRED